MKTITIEELEALKDAEKTIVDIRPQDQYMRGTFPGAVSLPASRLEEQYEEETARLDKMHPVYVMCHTGEKSQEWVRRLTGDGFDAVNVEGGYRAWLRLSLSRFVGGESEADREIAVCISGGKDSMLMAKLFQELKKHGKFQFETVFLVMNPGYNADNWKIIQDNAKLLGIPLTVFESDIFDTVATIEQNPCYLCARMRRGHLYAQAKALGCNKIALGHHFDDVIETILMGMLYSGKIETMMPKLHSQNFEGMELIRPMYLIKEDAVKAWRDYNGLQFIQCACRFTENCASCGGGRGSKRDEMKELIAHFRKESDVIEKNIFKSVHNINLKTVIGYHKDDWTYNFLDDYNDKK